MSVTFPSLPIKAVRWKPERSVGMQVSQYNFAQVVFDWGGELREGVIDIDRMTREELGDFRAFTLEAGTTENFLYTDEDIANPRGSPAGTPLINGASLYFRHVFMIRKSEATCDI